MEDKIYAKRPDLYDENAGMAAYRRKLLGLPRDPSLWDQDSAVDPNEELVESAPKKAGE